jgi:hypothetical protein
MAIDDKEQYILTIILGKLGFSNLGFFLTNVGVFPRGILESSIFYPAN